MQGFLTESLRAFFSQPILGDKSLFFLEVIGVFCVIFGPSQSFGVRLPPVFTAGHVKLALAGTPEFDKPCEKSGRADPD